MTPIRALQQRPLDLSRLFSATFAVLGRRFGLLFGLGALAVIPLWLAFGLGSIPLVLGLISLTNGQGTDWGTLGGGTALLVATQFVSALCMARAAAMQCVVVDGCAGGQRVTFAGAWARTRGHVVRLVAFLAVCFLVGLVLYSILGGLMYVANAPFAQTSGPTPEPSPLFVLPILLSYLVLYVGLIWLGVKLGYLVPAMALEGLTGFAASRRSWTITRGQFWRTLGWTIVISGVASFAYSFVSYFLSLFAIGPIVVASQGAQAGLDTATIYLRTLPWIMLALLPQMLLLALFVAYQQVFVTLMFRDQRHRDEMVAAGIPLTGPYGPAYGAPMPPQGYGPQGYGPQGYGPQAYPSPYGGPPAPQNTWEPSGPQGQPGQGQQPGGPRT
ncbi:glycerophosphoryl diester phosphodiesterase membrane domain-containing protein [Mariniluteicoccus flavus]